MMTVYSREYYQAGLAEGKIKAKKLDKYRLGPDFILAYDLGPAASYRTLLVDRKQGEIVLRVTTKTLLAHFVKPGGYPLQDKLYKLLGIPGAARDFGGACGNFFPGILPRRPGGPGGPAADAGMEACQGGLLMTDLAGVNCYFFQVKRGYANASRQVKEAVEHNALYCSLFSWPGWAGGLPGLQTG